MYHIVTFQFRNLQIVKFCCGMILQANYILDLATRKILVT